MILLIIVIWVKLLLLLLLLGISPISILNIFITPFVVKTAIMIKVFIL